MNRPPTPGGRYFVVRGRLWRCTNPALGNGERSNLTVALMSARRAGAGTRIDLWLPICGDAVGPVRIADRSAPETFKGRALVVDDESFVRMTTADMLQSLGYETEDAEGAREAERRMLDGARFTLVVSDHLMPGMTGVELATRIRDRFPYIPVHTVSGYAETIGISSDFGRRSWPMRSRNCKCTDIRRHWRR